MGVDISEIQDGLTFEGFCQYLFDEAEKIGIDRPDGINDAVKSFQLGLSVDTEDFAVIVACSKAYIEYREKKASQVCHDLMKRVVETAKDNPDIGVMEL